MKNMYPFWLIVLLSIQSILLMAAPLQIRDCPIYPVWLWRRSGFLGDIVENSKRDPVMAKYLSKMNLDPENSEILVISEAGNCRVNRTTIENWEKLAGESHDILYENFKSIAPELKTTLTELDNGNWIFRGNRIFTDTGPAGESRSFGSPDEDGTLDLARSIRYRNDRTLSIFLGILVVYPTNNQRSIRENPTIKIDGSLPITYGVDPRVVVLGECIDLPVIANESIVQPFKINYDRDPLMYSRLLAGITAVGTGTTTGTCTTRTGEMAFTVAVTA